MLQGSNFPMPKSYTIHKVNQETIQIDEPCDSSSEEVSIIDQVTKI